MRIYDIAKGALCALALLPFAVGGLHSGSAEAGSRYGTPPPLTLSSDLASPWTLQLKPRSRASRAAKRRTMQRRMRVLRTVRRKKAKTIRRTNARAGIQTAAVTTGSAALRRSIAPSIKADLLPTKVYWGGNERPGTVIVNTIERRLYLILPNNEARRYAVGVGKPGFEWAGSHKVTRKAEWPSWTPPKEMIARERKKGRILPNYMPGGPKNPMGARALYLGSSIYRIHGTTQNWSIGKAVSSGCIRMRNQDVMDLYDRVPVGARVKVI